MIFISLQAQDYKTYTAKTGDGVYTLLSKFGYSSSYFSDFVELNKTKLGKDNSLFIGEVYRLPLKEKVETDVKSLDGETKNYKIFGPDYENVKILDLQLSGAVFYILSGHGGPDPGAVGNYGSHSLCEDEYAYDVGLRLSRMLIEHGALVYMITRDKNDGIRDESYLVPDKDEVCYPDLKIPLSQNSRLRQRVRAVNKIYSQNKGKYQRMIVIHVDSRSKGENIDTFFYYYKRSTKGKKAAVNLQETFQAKYDKYQPGRGYKGTISTRNLYVLHYSYPPAIFIELGNINHQKDQQRFIKVSNRKALAKWLSEGLLEDFEENRP